MVNLREKSYLLIAFLLVAALSLAACGTATGTGSESQAVPTSTPEEAAAVEEPTPTVEEEPASEEEASTETITPTPEMTETTVISEVAEVAEEEAIPPDELIPMTISFEAMQGRSLFASDVIGYRIQNLDGDNIGKIEDIVVNMVDGHILFLTVSYGGSLFQSAKVFPVPASAFIWDPDNESFRLNLDEATLEEAPGFESGWPDMTAEDYDPMVYDAEVTAYWSEQYPDLVAVTTEVSTVAGAVAKVSDMIGLNVENPAGESIGEISDIIINAEQQLLSAAVLTFGGLRLIGDDSYVIPYAAFSLDTSTVDNRNPLGTPVLDLTANNLANAPKFDSGSVDVADPNWSEPYLSWWVRMAETASSDEGPLSLAMTSWVLESFGEPEDNLTVLPGTRPTVNFFVERYGGSGGCNWYLGVYSAGEDGSLRMETPSTSIPAVCEPEGVMQQEATFMTSLVNVTEYQMEGENLVGYTVENQRMLTLAPAEPAPFELTPWGLRFFVADIQWVPLLIGTEITAQFEGNQLSGLAGCNTYTATVDRQDDMLTITDIVVTDAVCSEPDGIMQQEDQFLSALGTVTGYVQLGDMLQLVDSDGNAVLIFGLEIETP